MMARRTATNGRVWRGRARRCLSLLLVFFLVPGTVPMGLAYSTDQPVPPAAVQPAQPTPAQLQQLVAPIALYPDELIAQILAAATYPEQVVEAERWMQQHGELRDRSWPRRSTSSHGTR